MLETLSHVRECIAGDKTILNSLREVNCKEKFADLLIEKSKEWGINLTRKTILEELLLTPTGINFEISEEMLDANPSFTEIFCCTDNSNFTAQRPSCCLTCK